jgi:hypothetical protein
VCRIDRLAAEVLKNPFDSGDAAKRAHSRAARSRNAFKTTDTDDRLIARLAMIGDSSNPKAG